MQIPTHVKDLKNRCEALHGVIYTADVSKAVASYEELFEAAKQVLDWYDRDCSVGGASEAIEALRDAMESGQESSETPS